jgi:isochorismate synthase
MLLSLGRSRGRGLVSVRLPEALLGKLAWEGIGSLRRRATVSWEPPDGETSLFGLGIALKLRGDGTALPGEAARQMRELASTAIAHRVADVARPRFFGGWRFAPEPRSGADARWDSFGGWQFIVPAITVAIRDGEWAATATTLVDEEVTETDIDRMIAAALTGRGISAVLTLREPRAASAAPGPEDWTAAVAKALDEISAKTYEKVVLARQVRVQLDDSMDSAALRERLRSRYPNCWVFGFESEGRTWLGASPELMVSASEREVNAASLAGSRRRGTTPEEDRALIAELLGSNKERLEHLLVARAIGDGLAPFCDALDVPSEPTLLQTHNIQHLYTPIRGHLRNGYDVLDLAAALHPTPAVGGWPRAAALDAIGRLERMDRGWYAAPIGWMDFKGDGVFAVGLRAGLLEGRELTLYAGNGIVAGSIPEAELAETELKLGSVRAAAVESEG